MNPSLRLFLTNIIESAGGSTVTRDLSKPFYYVLDDVHYVAFCLRHLI